MDNVEQLWHILGNLSYAEMLSVAEHLQDTKDTISPDLYDDAYGWAKVLEAARCARLADDG